MNQETINKNMQKEIDREVMIMRAAERVRLNSEQRRSVARRKIEALKESQALEDDQLLDFE